MSKTDISDDDEEYEAYEDKHLSEWRYPLHDCCETEDIEVLRVRTIAGV
jgi:hypothetical protein